MRQPNPLLRAGSVFYAHLVGEMRNVNMAIESNPDLVETGQEIGVDQPMLSSRPKIGEFDPLDIWISEDFDDPMPEREEATSRSAEELQAGLDSANFETL